MYCSEPTICICIPAAERLFPPHFAKYPAVHLRRPTSRRPFSITGRNGHYTDAAAQAPAIDSLSQEYIIADGPRPTDIACTFHNINNIAGAVDLAHPASCTRAHAGTRQPECIAQLHVHSLCARSVVAASRKVCTVVLSGHWLAAVFLQQRSCLERAASLARQLAAPAGSGQGQRASLQRGSAANVV